MKNKIIFSTKVKISEEKFPIMYCELDNGIYTKTVLRFCETKTTIIDKSEFASGLSIKLLKIK